VPSSILIAGVFGMKILARLLTFPSTSQRNEVRRRVLYLEVAVITSDQGVSAPVYDLSTTGLRIESDTNLDVGEEILVSLPEVGEVKARVVWKDRNTYGCAFLEPIPKRVVGAVVLQAPFEEPSASQFNLVQEVEVGRGVDIDSLAQWYADFEQRRASSGEQLIGFRKVDDHFVALIALLN
jgi:hypothetical protein